MMDQNKHYNEQNLFYGTAEYYRRFRVPYPEILIESLSAELHLDGTGMMLDVGCGTGEVIEAIGGRFARVLGIDPDRDMLKEASNRIRRLACKHVEFRKMSAEDISSLTEKFRLVTFGASFHWSDRISTANSVMELLQAGGAIVLLGSNSTWKGQERWQQIALEQLQSYLGQQRRAGEGHYEENSLRHQEVLEQVGFSDVKTMEFDIPYCWTLQNFIGYLFSTSFASKEVLGDKASAFENSLKKALLEYDSRGIYQEIMKFYYICGKK